MFFTFFLHSSRPLLVTVNRPLNHDYLAFLYILMLKSFKACQSRGLKSRCGSILARFRCILLFLICRRYPFIFLANIRPDVWSDKNCLPTLLQLWHRGTTRNWSHFSKLRTVPPRFNAIPGEYLFASRRSFLRDTKCYTIAHDRAEKNINGRLTYPSIVLVINDLSRSTHTDTRIAAPTDRQTKICYCGGLDNRALQAKFDSRNRNIPCMQYSK